MRVRACVVGLALMASTLAVADPASAAPAENAVAHWSGVAEVAISANPTPPPPPAPPGLRPPASSTVLAAMVHGAMYDAAAATEGHLKPFATRVRAPKGASPEAAVGKAARDVLVTRVPGQAATVQSAYETFMDQIPDGPGKTAGQAVGTAAAAGMLAYRTGDRFDDAVPYVQRTPGPGVFEPIAPSTPVDAKLPSVRPFTYSGPAFRPAAPYGEKDRARALSSRRYTRDVAELKTLGRATGSSRTSAQTETAHFYGAQAPTYVHFSRALRDLVSAKRLNLRESARLLGYTWVSTGDTMIACWEAKYHYTFWRPDHAIQRADTDGNPATTPDPTWTPLIIGNHPEYPSGHACFAAGVTTSVERYFGTDRVAITMPALSPIGGPARTYADLDDLVADIENARVWGGLHYRTTMEATADHFPRVAHRVGDRHFLARHR